MQSKAKKKAGLSLKEGWTPPDATCTLWQAVAHTAPKASVCIRPLTGPLRFISAQRQLGGAASASARPDKLETCGLPPKHTHRPCGLLTALQIASVKLLYKCNHQLSWICEVDLDDRKQGEQQCCSW